MEKVDIQSNAPVIPESEILSIPGYATLSLFMHNQNGDIIPLQIDLDSGQAAIIGRDRTITRYSETELLGQLEDPTVIVNMAFFTIISRNNGELLISNGQKHFGITKEAPELKRQLTFNYEDDFGLVQVVAMYGETKQEVELKIQKAIDQRIAYLAKQRGIN